MGVPWIVIFLAGCTTPVRLDASPDEAGPEDASMDATTDAGVDAGPDAGPPDAGPPPCDRGAMAACDNTLQCCSGLTCGTNTRGQVCCGLEQMPCTDITPPVGEDCCGELGCDTHNGGGALRCCSYPGGPCINEEGCCGYHECVGNVCQ